MGSLFGIAGVQMRIVPGDMSENLNSLFFTAREIKESFPWIDMICFPELCIHGINFQGWEKLAVSIPGKVTEQLSQLAIETGKWIVPGSMFEQAEGKIYNTSIVFSPEGEMVAKYRKLFPWKPIEETAPGDAFCVFEIEGVGIFGLTICYDIWFPEVVRSLVWMGAEVIIHPSLTTTSDRILEHTLVQANAISNQCFVIDINGIVSPFGGGTSIFVDPNGRILQKRDTSEAIMTEVLDLDTVRDTREYGTYGLCQTLKQLKHFKTPFPIYDDALEKGALYQRLSDLRLHRTLRTEESTDQ